MPIYIIKLFTFEKYANNLTLYSLFWGGSTPRYRNFAHFIGFHIYSTFHVFTVMYASLCLINEIYKSRQVI